FGCLLALVPAGIAISLTHDFSVVYVVTIGLLLFALLFAMNSALHSFQIVRFARVDGASLDIGFYYMANAGGRLAGTVASGALYQVYGLDACLWVSALLIVFGSLTALSLLQEESGTA
ncbi:MAG: MFS transporter, partial [Pseudomonadota bacterium]|nr:MFS transporter [Pseudomonadota bacterium]